MAVCWILAGATRPAERTALGRRLCEVLPRATHLELGAAPPRPDGPANYFRRLRELNAFVAARQDAYEHLLVTATPWERRGRGDLLVSLEAAPSARRAELAPPPRRDEIFLGGADGPEQWEPALRRWLPERPGLRMVLAVLQEQQRLHVPEPQVRSKLWLVVEQEHFLGFGLVHLLDEIEQYGSIRAAARVCGMSYRGAWDLIKGAERRLGAPLLNPQAGGPYGGGSSLSVAGRRWRDGFKRLNREVESFANARFAKLLAAEAR